MNTDGHTADWHERRAKTIGGSDAPVVMGLSPYKTALELWKEKTGRLLGQEQEMSADMKRGTELEPIVRAKISKDLGAIFHAGDHFYMHPLNSGISGNMDGIFNVKDHGEKFIWECKCPRSGSYLKTKREGKISDAWQIQCQHYSMILKLPVLLTVFSAEYWEYQNFWIRPDGELQDQIYRAESAFLEYIKTDVQPVDAITAPKLDLDPAPNGTLTIPAGQIPQEFIDLKTAEEYLRDADDVYELAKQAAIKALEGLGSNCVEAEGLGRFHMTSSTRKSFDSKAFLKAHNEFDKPEFYKETAVKAFKPYFFKPYQGI